MIITPKYDTLVMCLAKMRVCLQISRGREFYLSWSHTFVKIDYEIISMVILLPSAESFNKG